MNVAPEVIHLGERASYLPDAPRQPSNQNALDLIEADLIVAPVVELGGAGRGMVGDHRLALRLAHIPTEVAGGVSFRAHEGETGVVMRNSGHHDMCGRPLRSKRNLQERCGPWSGADMCAASAAARSMPRAQMGVRRSGPIQAHALEALVAKLVFLIRSLDRAPSLSSDPPTPRQPRGRDGAYTAATGAR